MQIAHTLPNAAGLRLASHPVPYAIPTDPAAALVFASFHDRRADALLAEGRTDAAERAAHLAYEARSRAAGGGA